MTHKSYLRVCVSSENSQEATEYHEEQGDKQNDNAYVAHKLASQQVEEPIEQEDDHPIADDDSMADQADEPDSDDEDNALEQQDDDDDNQLSAQGKTTWPCTLS